MAINSWGVEVKVRDEVQKLFDEIRVMAARTDSTTDPEEAANTARLMTLLQNAALALASQLDEIDYVKKEVMKTQIDVDYIRHEVTGLYKNIQDIKK